MRTFSIIDNETDQNVISWVTIGDFYHVGDLRITADPGDRVNTPFATYNFKVKIVPSAYASTNAVTVYADLQIKVDELSGFSCSTATLNYVVFTNGDLYDHSSGDEVPTKYVQHASTAAKIAFEAPRTATGIDCGTSTYEIFSDAAATIAFSPSWVTIDDTNRELSFDIPTSGLFGTTKTSADVYMKTTMTNGSDTLINIAQVTVIACTIVDYMIPVISNINYIINLAGTDTFNTCAINIPKWS